MIEVVCGPMFSGKTTEMLRRLRRAKIAGKRVMLFKPLVDDRAGDQHTSTHDQVFANCQMVSDVGLITEATRESFKEIPVVIGIDEYQFFQDHKLAQYLWAVAKHGMVTFVIAGLDRDYRGEPFPMMSSVMGYATKVDKLTAVCIKCGEDANMSYRKTDSEESIEIGGADKYEARCITCWRQQTGGKRVLLPY